MFGWEFPPVKSGGLGTVCYSLTKAMVKKGIQITFVMPTGPKGIKGEFVNLLVANKLDYENIKLKPIKSLLTPYLTFNGYDEVLKKIRRNKNAPEVELYGQNLYHEVWRFSEMAKVIAANETFDIIHCHDWMTVQAAINAKKISGKPMIMHIHNTIFDRGAGHGNPYEYELEKKGFDAADKIIAISQRVKDMVVNKYSIDPNKIEVIYWGIEQDDPAYNLNYKSPLSKLDNSKIVLFLGRITIQKGPDYLIEAAKKILQFEPNTKFVFVGSGDMEPQIIRRCAELGIGQNVIFSGFLSGAEVHKAFQMADVYVMPSISEPFGVVALESMRNGTPCIISKQSGVSEVVKNCLKVDFWDIDQLASKVLGVIKYKPLHKLLKQNGLQEAKSLTYEETANKVIGVYQNFVPIYATH